MIAAGARLLRSAYLDWPALASAALATRDGFRRVLDLARARGSLTRAGWRGDARCVRCGLAARVPGVSLDLLGRCRECVAAPVPGLPPAILGALPEISLARIAETAARRCLVPRADGGVDAVVALSGGKDSLLALIGARALDLRVVAVTLDNGFLLAPALANARAWCERLGVPLAIRREPMHDVVRAALRRKRLVPWPCIACFDRLSRVLLAEAARVDARTILTGLRYRWPSGSALAPASEAFAPYAPPREAARVAVLNLPAALGLTETEERALLARLGWHDPGLEGHSTNCLLPAHFEHLHRTRVGHPHESVRFVAREAREGVITAALAVARMAGAPPRDEHRDELARRLAEDGRE
ncbi:MAG: hypothetical protein U0610_07550 [bacterium]